MTMAGIESYQIKIVFKTIYTKHKLLLFINTGN